MFITWLIVALVCVAIFLSIRRSWEAGFLNLWRVRLSMVVSMLLGLVLLIVLKALHVSVEKDARLGAEFSAGLCRRLGDISWWGVILVTFMSGVAILASSNPLTKTGRFGRQAWLVSTSISVGAYLVFVFRARESFFWPVPWNHPVKWIQIVEGAMMVAWIAVGHFFLVQIITGLSTIALVGSGTRRLRLALPAVIYGSIPAVISFPINNWSDLMKLCSSCCGVSEAPPNFAKIVYQVLGLWWPLVVLPFYWLRAWLTPASVVVPTADE